VLIIQCFCNTLTLEAEWTAAVHRVEQARPPIPFREVFLIEPVMWSTATLYGRRHKRRR
jgi:hypothetical protein